MSTSSKSIVFILDGQVAAKVSADGRIRPATTPITRIEQIDNRAELGREAWIVEKFPFASSNTSHSSLVG